jgi:hypothetical protein
MTMRIDQAPMGVTTSRTSDSRVSNDDGSVPGRNQNEYGRGEPLVLMPGRVVALVGPPGFGLTRLGLSMVGEYAAAGPVVCVDVRGWISPTAAWEAGVPADRLVVVRAKDPVQWAKVVSVVLEGVGSVYAEVPGGVHDAHIRRLAALSRRSKTPLILRPVRGRLPAGIAQLTVTPETLQWEGVDQGYGRLTHRRLMLLASGKVMRGMTTMIEVEDDGANALHLVPGLAPAPARHANG